MLVMNVLMKCFVFIVFDNIEEYVLLVFFKWVKVLYGFLFEGGFEVLEEESFRCNKKGCCKLCFSMFMVVWWYSS